jgi:hypothetical protein
MLNSLLLFIGIVAVLGLIGWADAKARSTPISNPKFPTYHKKKS